MDPGHNKRLYDSSTVPNPDLYHWFIQAVFRIRIGFHADPDPYSAFTLMRIQIRIRIQGAKPMRIRIQILVGLCRHKKWDFDMKNILLFVPVKS